MKEVIIVGVGALGSHVVQFLRNEANLTIIDFDRVEAKNTMAQFHSSLSTGKLKVEVLTALMSLLWKKKLRSNSNKLITGNADALLGASKMLGGTADLIIDCLDNAEARKLVQDTAKQAPRIPCLHGALAADGQFGRVAWSEHFKIDSEQNAGAPTCEGGEHLPFCAIVAGYIARSAQLFLRDGKRLGFQITPTNVVAV